MNFGSFFSDFCAALTSGVVLALLFFLFREWWHPLPSLTGHWYFETEVITSTNPDYLNLRLKYEATLWQAGPSVKGSAEKIFEHNSREAFEYDNAKRTRGDLEGYIDRFYLRRNRIVLHLGEKGRLRDSSSILDLHIEKADLVGTLQSTAAGTFAKVTWSRQKDSPRF